PGGRARVDRSQILATRAFQRNSDAGLRALPVAASGGRRLARALLYRGCAAVSGRREEDPMQSPVVLVTHSRALYQRLRSAAPPGSLQRVRCLGSSGPEARTVMVDPRAVDAT